MLLPFFMSIILSFYTYILYSSSHDRYYVGQCEDLNARLARHNSGIVTSTKSYRPWELVYFESFETRSEAVQRETQIKKMKSRIYIERLIKK